MPQIVIDGVNVETSPGKTVIQAAYDNGMQIPHFCWHPELSVSGNCRMCLVEIGMPKRAADGNTEKGAEGNPVIVYFPKLQIACATVVSDGMHVKTKSEKAVKTQEAVMEFLLINHPLDCPICDEAGQCKLQEYAYRNSAGESRFDDEKNHKPKNVAWSQNIVFDAERCISCSRCIRFSKEIANQDVLTFVNRGDRVTIEVAKGKQLNNDYSMNVIDICPVGALTSKDFRFKARVWDMSFNDSICPGCARGCNIKLGVRNNEILRSEPRANPNVNKYWMCDYGRLTQYGFVNENRIKDPKIRYRGGIVKCTWDEAVSNAVDYLKRIEPDEIMILGSAKATNEDNYLLAKFASTLLKTKNIGYLNHIDETFGDNFLKLNDKSPNSTGVAEVGINPVNGGIKLSELGEKIKSKKIKAVYSLDDDFKYYRGIEDELENLEVFIVHAHNQSRITEKAHIIFPASAYAETEGTFTNADKIVQHFTPAIVTAENLRFMGMKMSRLDKFGAQNDRWTQHELRNCLPSWRIIKMIADLFDGKWNYKSAEDVFREIAETIPSFKGMTYKLLDEYKGLTLGKPSLPDVKPTYYESHVMKPD